MNNDEHQKRSISNLSTGLIETAFILLEQKALPIYRRNCETRQPGLVAYPERTAAGAAILLLCSGLDYHLSRLKYFVDLCEGEPPGPYRPYFNWKINDYLPVKISQLLRGKQDGRLKKQLIEITAVRDAIAHPKFYLIEETFGSDSALIEQKVGLVEGSGHRRKTIEIKHQTKESTQSLGLPLVPTWLSYRDGVLLILVLHRFFNLIKDRYGKGHWIGLGGFFVKSQTKGFFKDSERNVSIHTNFEEWVWAFFESLSPTDQRHLEKVLQSPIKFYLKKTPDFPKRQLRSGFTLEKFFKDYQNPPLPNFYKKLPSWKRINPL